MNRLKVAGALSATLLMATPFMAEAQVLEGRWEGIVIIRPAEYEMDVVLDISRKGDGNTWKGFISYPTQDVRMQPLESLNLDEQRVTFKARDENGVASLYEGWISENGEEISGDLAESGQHYLFRLHRSKEGKSSDTSKTVNLRHLSGDGKELREAFNADVGKIRLLMVLSPSCIMCKNGARLVQRYVLDQIPASDLRVYTVWEPIQPTDSELKAKAASDLLTDPRVVQFWADNRFAGTSLQKLLGLKSSPAWDVFLLFSRAAQWSDAPGTPEFFMHNLVLAEEDLPKDKRLNAKQLAQEIGSLLTATKESSKGHR